MKKYFELDVQLHENVFSQSPTKFQRDRREKTRLTVDFRRDNHWQFCLVYWRFLDRPQHEIKTKNNWNQNKKFNDFQDNLNQIERNVDRMFHNNDVQRWISIVIGQIRISTGIAQRINDAMRPSEKVHRIIFRNRKNKRFHEILLVIFIELSTNQMEIRAFDRIENCG